MRKDALWILGAGNGFQASPVEIYDSLRILFGLGFLLSFSNVGGMRDADANTSQFIYVLLTNYKYPLCAFIFVRCPHSCCCLLLQADQEN